MGEPDSSGDVGLSARWATATEVSLVMYIPFVAGPHDYAYGRLKALSPMSSEASASTVLMLMVPFAGRLARRRLLHCSCTFLHASTYESSDCCVYRRNPLDDQRRRIFHIPVPSFVPSFLFSRSCGTKDTLSNQTQAVFLETLDNQKPHSQRRSFQETETSRHDCAALLLKLISKF